jgi:hypothetical protein
MKSILFSAAISTVLFITVSYIQRAAAEPCTTSGCCIEEPVTLPQADCSTSNC